MIDKNKIYLVASCWRAGSSMMMRCLHNAGMDAVYDNSRFNFNPDESYDANPNGFYESQIDFSSPTLMADYGGKLIKCGFKSILKLPIGNYYMVFMLRNPVESDVSYQRAFGRALGIYELYEEYLTSLFKAIDARGDIEYIKINFADVISNPVNEFSKINMPIDVNIASSFVDNNLYRNRL